MEIASIVAGFVSLILAVIAIWQTITSTHKAKIPNLALKLHFLPSKLKLKHSRLSTDAAR